MKKIELHLEVEFPALTIYREELDEIVEKLQNACSSVRIYDDTYNYDSLDEVKENKGNKVKKLYIEGKSPNIEVYLGRGFIERKTLISMWGYNDTNKVIYYDLKEIVGKTVSVGGKISSYINNSKVALALFPIAGLGMSGLFLLRQNTILNILWLACIFTFGLFVFTFIYSAKSTTIHLEKKHTTKFWNKNKDNIIVGLIRSLFAAALGVLGTLIYQKYFK